MYKIDFTEGCVCFSYLINGVEFVDTSEDIIKDLLITLIKHNTKTIEIMNIIEDILADIFEYENINDYEFDVCNLWPLVLIDFDNSLKYPEYNANQEKIATIVESLNKEDIQKLKKVAESLINKFVFKDLGWMQQVIIDLVKSDKDTIYECSDKPCECCGDYIENYKLCI